MTRFLEISNHTLFWYYLASNIGGLQNQCGTPT